MPTTTNLNITGIQVGMEEVTVVLYADDLLIHITNPNQSLPELFTTLQEHSNLSGYKLNYKKTEVMPLNAHTHCDTHPVLSKFKWQPKGFKYLAIFITNDLKKGVIHFSTGRKAIS